jgi:hypothetical protein
MAPSILMNRLVYLVCQGRDGLHSGARQVENAVAQQAAFADAESNEFDLIANWATHHQEEAKAMTTREPKIPGPN